jgi:hypothetical protein
MRNTWVEGEWADCNDLSTTLATRSTTMDPFPQMVTVVNALTKIQGNLSLYGILKVKGDTRKRCKHPFCDEVHSNGHYAYNMNRGVSEEESKEWLYWPESYLHYLSVHHFTCSSKFAMFVMCLYHSDKAETLDSLSST